MKFVSYDLRKSAREWLEKEGCSKLATVEALDKPVFPMEPEGGDSDDLDSDDDREDTWAEQLGLGMSAEFSSSPVQSSCAGGPRTSTGIRVLGYLAQFRYDPAVLAIHYRLLRDSPAPLLHLCGCGICNDGQKGCIEPSHLRLGTQEENLNHTHWHAVLKAAADGPKPEYDWLVRFIQGRCPDGPGIF